MGTNLHLSIRALTPLDTVAYRAIRLYGLQHEPTAFTGSFAEEAQMPETTFAARLAVAEPSAVFGAFDAATLVGIVAFQVPVSANLNHKGTLWGMYTVPTVRHLGVGRALLHHVLAHARQHATIEHILLAVSASNTRASQWYEKAGFRLYGIEPHAVRLGTRYEDDELRVLDLRASADRGEGLGDAENALAYDTPVGEQISHHPAG